MFVYFVSVNPLTFYLDSPPEIGVILKMKLWSRQGPFICLPMTWQENPNEWTDRCRHRHWTAIVAIMSCSPEAG